MQVANVLRKDNPKDVKGTSKEFGNGKEVPKIQRPCCFTWSTVLTDRGSSASLVTAARVLDVNSCEGAASDAESAYTHLKMEEAPDCQSQNVRLFDLETSTTFSMSKIMRQNRRSCGST